MISSDVIILPIKLSDGENAWIATNVFTRTSLAMTAEGLSILSQPKEFSDTALVKIWNIQIFSNIEGLLADPTRFIRETSDWPAPEGLTKEKFLEKCRQNLILIENPDEYQARFSPKKSLLDWHNLGNFHQQLGQELIVKHRISPELWWINQKFSEDRKSLKENLYGAVQGKFLETYFASIINSKTSVVDVGCGTGFYANKMAAKGATVIGIDPTESYISEANNTAVAGATFKLGYPGTKNGLSEVYSGWADYVFMSDALLYYFTPISAEEKPSLSELFSEIKRILKPTGSFISVEPHCIFYHQPWLGDKIRPFTAISEYNTKSFSIVPTLTQLFSAFCEHGFSVCKFQEMLPDESFKQIDPRAYYFAKEFPVWHLIESKPNL